MTVEDIKKIQIGAFDGVSKKLGIELHDVGLLRYSKLTPDNYDYRWYEVEDITKINKNKFTYDRKDMEKTRKRELYYKTFELTGNPSINAFLNLECARNDGIGNYERIFDLWYGKKESYQPALF